MAFLQKVCKILLKNRSNCGFNRNLVTPLTFEVRIQRLCRRSRFQRQPDPLAADILIVKENNTAHLGYKFLGSVSY